MTSQQKIKNIMGTFLGGLLLLYTTACTVQPPNKNHYAGSGSKIITPREDKGVFLVSSRDDEHIDYICRSYNYDDVVAVDTSVEKKFNEKLKDKFVSTPFLMDEQLRKESEQYVKAYWRFAYYLDSTIYAQDRAFRDAHKKK